LARTRRRSISTPIVLGIFTVLLSIALLVGWILVLVQNLHLTERVGQNATLIVLGSLSFAVIITVLVLFSVFLVREIRMVNRQTRFVDSVTHELKSPLASLKLLIETLKRDDLMPGQRIEVHQMMLDDVDRLSIFIDDVLQASRLSYPGEGHALEDVVLADLVESCAGGIVRYYKQPPEAIEVRIPPGLILVTDRTVFETVIKNLLDNALKYSLGLDRPVLVTVDAHLEARHVHLKIRDRGVGIPKRYQRRIFERFYRVPHDSVRACHGTGLGLYVASALVRLLGGKLTVHSEGLDLGTVMHVKVPMKKREENQESLTVATRKNPVHERSRTEDATPRR